VSYNNNYIIITVIICVLPAGVTDEETLLSPDNKVRPARSLPDCTVAIVATGAVAKGRDETAEPSCQSIAIPHEYAG
jgi:hypothetical protein